MSGFAHRGVVEGFYGQPYSHEERLAWLEFLASHELNTFVYAPKDDPLHRERWPEPYDETILREFSTLVQRGRELGVRVGFAVSPGVSMVYSDPAQLQDLRGKIEQFRGAGTDFLCLALDDVPTTFVHRADREHFPSLAAAHVEVAHQVQSWIGDATLWLVPTDYVGTGETEYLQEIGSELDSRIEVGWTGRTVLSPSITAEEARKRAAILRRKPLLWDNVPVADGPMRAALHLGPYAGRDPGLTEQLSGVLLNPMVHPRASRLTVGTAAAFLRDPQHYDADAEWDRLVEEIGAGAPEAFRTFASAHRFGPMSPRERDPELEAVWERLRDADGPEASAVQAFSEAVAQRVQCRAAVEAGLEDRKLLKEVTPWLVSHHLESARLSAAADLLESLVGESEGTSLLRELFRFEAHQRVELPFEASYGPRRLLYPQLASLDDRGATFGEDPVLFRNLSLADAIVNFVEDMAIEALSRNEK